MFCKSVLQKRQGHDSGFHLLMAVLRLSTYSLFFKSFGRLSHIFDPKNSILSKPWFTLLTWGITEFVWFRKLQFPSSLTRKTSCIISGEVLVCNLKISIASACRFSWRIETELGFSNRSSKDNCLSLYINRRHLSVICLFYCYTFCYGTSILMSSNWVGPWKK